MNRCHSPADHRTWSGSQILLVGLALATLSSAGPAALEAQQQILETPEQTVSVSRGGSALIQRQMDVQRVSVADPDVADAVVMSPTEILINGQTVGSTSLFIWDAEDVPHLFQIEVTADIAALRRQLGSTFPEEEIEVSSAGGGVVVLSGTVRDPGVVRRAVELAEATGATVINNMQAPPLEQILLEVQFAEVDRNVLKKYGADFRFLNPQRYDDAVEGRKLGNSDVESETLSEGIVRLLLLGDRSEFESFIDALKSRGSFRSLAEPNLMVVEGQEATFLAGGEFPFPVVQGGSQSGAVTIMWKEFGVRLRFTPTVTPAGTIRLTVAPEVSALDFASGLELQGFQIPTLTTRRVESEVELREGQHLALAGLVDNSITETITKIPILGDIPVLGRLFQSKDAREQRTELLVLVTPHFVEPSNARPELPTGQPEEWEWDGEMRYPSEMPSSLDNDEGGL